MTNLLPSTLALVESASALSPFLHTVAVGCLVVLFVTAGMCLYRLMLGPTPADRAVAFDGLSTVFIGIICLLCILWRSDYYFDAVWILTLVGYLGSVAIAKYLEKGRVIR
ncbi:MAG: monovalent cation/H+ antiporter complex subunit F [Phycisphaeraceae bacterium]